MLLCGGTKRRRDEVRRCNKELIGQADPISVGDVESLLRCAPKSRAVVVCGELAGMSVSTVDRLITERAPHAEVIRADQLAEDAGAARSSGRYAAPSRSGRRAISAG